MAGSFAGSTSLGRGMGPSGMCRVFILPDEVLLGGDTVCGKGMDGGRRCPTDIFSCPLPDALLLDRFSGCS